MKLNTLNDHEKAIILQKGTEAPFSGRYVHHAENGTYLCRQCDSVLYLSSAKFESHCGWPSFDDAVSGGVSEKPDPDGRRTEIVCAGCGAHLGHVFRGEHFTPNDTRHCVNSASLDFSPEIERNV
jgi:methionine-R-sulfoxide reductase